MELAILAASALRQGTARHTVLVVVTFIVVRHKILRSVLIRNASRKMMKNGFGLIDRLPATLAFSAPS